MAGAEERIVGKVGLCEGGGGVADRDLMGSVVVAVVVVLVMMMVVRAL